MGWKGYEESTGKRCLVCGKDGFFFFPESKGENSYFMGTFYTLKYLACTLMDCNNEPMLYEVSTNIVKLVTVRDIS